MLFLQKKSALKCPGVMPNDQEGRQRRFNQGRVEWASALAWHGSEEPSDHIPLVVTFDLPDVEDSLGEELNSKCLVVYAEIGDGAIIFSAPTAPEALSWIMCKSSCCPRHCPLWCPYGPCCFSISRGEPRSLFL